MSNDAATLEQARDAIRRYVQSTRAVNVPTTSVLEEAKAAYAATMQTYRDMGISPRDYLGPIWANNLEQHLIPNIRACETVEQAIGYLNDKAFYDFSCGEPYLTPSIDWRLDFLRRTQGVDVQALPPALCESPYVLDKHCKTVAGRRLSSDFLNRLAWVFRLQTVLDFPQQPFGIIEVGGGFGALARVFKILYPQSRIVLVDIPESLFFQHAFMKASFPDAKHQFVSRIDEPIGDADIVYVPNCFAAALQGSEFFLAVNTNSFGEMPETASSRWLELLRDCGLRSVTRQRALQVFETHCSSCAAKDAPQFARRVSELLLIDVLVELSDLQTMVPDFSILMKLSLLTPSITHRCDPAMKLNKSL